MTDPTFRPPQTAIHAHQAALTASLLSLLTPPPANTPTPPPRPGRPARALIARILLSTFRRGETKGLFDVGQALLKGLVGSEMKGAVERDKEWRVASGYVLGELWTEFGGQVMSLFIDVVNTTTRIYRNSAFVSSSAAYLTLADLAPS